MRAAATATLQAPRSKYEAGQEGVAAAPRYCPSLESKVRRFPARNHLVWLEPEGLDTDVVYPNGLSNALTPPDQERMLRTVPGLERVAMLRPGYGVEYDYVDPRELRPTLETRRCAGLFLVGRALTFTSARARARCLAFCFVFESIETASTSSRRRMRSRFGGGRRLQK